MIIKYDGIYDDNLGNSAAKRVEGTKYEDGERWSKKFFANNKDLLREIGYFGVGELVNVKMKQDGKFWNIVGFEKPSQKLLDSITQKRFTGTKTKSNTNTSYQYKGRTAEAYDRSASIYLAMDILKTNKTPEEKISVEDLFPIAEMIFGYINKGETPGDGFKDDALDPFIEGEN